ncbi:hypothetical protein ACFQV2_26620 [Actinokineospora soli]|uniref:CopC domain-containing protein n=1 Tax=Actinokineospora soli TaxID=1048753 RepID=A0ABW2TU37_9PSEU
MSSPVRAAVLAAVLLGGALHPAPAHAATLAFTSPTASALTGAVDLEVAAPRAPRRSGSPSTAPPSPNSPTTTPSPPAPPRSGARPPTSDGSRRARTPCAPTP